MDVDKFLEDYFDKLKMIEVLEKQITDLESKLQYLNKNPKLEKLFSEKIFSLKNNIFSIKLKIHDTEAVLNAMYPEHIKFLELKFKDKLSWNNIEKELHKTRSALFKQHKKFREDFKQHLNLNKRN